MDELVKQLGRAIKEHRHQLARINAPLDVHMAMGQSMEPVLQILAQLEEKVGELGEQP